MYLYGKEKHFKVRIETTKNTLKKKGKTNKKRQNK